MAVNLSKKINPLALINSSLLLIPSTISGLLAGFAFSIGTGVLMSIGAAISVFGFSYVFYSKVNLNNHNFYKHLTINLSMVLGFLWGGMSIGPMIFMYGLSILSTGPALFLGGAIGLLSFLSINRFLNKITGLKDINSINLQAFGFMGMIIAGCIGLLWGPMGWIACSSLGLTIGVITGVISNFITKFNHTAKIMSGLLGIAGTMIGVMLGAVIGVLLPVISPITISLFFGSAFMLTGSVIGITIGKYYPKFDINNPSLQHRLYQAISLLDTVFFGYLAGGLIGFTVLPVNSILISQALGIIGASGLYGFINAGYYMLKNIVNKSSFPSEETDSPTVDSTSLLVRSHHHFDSAELQEAVQQACEQNPQMVKETLRQFKRVSPDKRDDFVYSSKLKM